MRYPYWPKWYWAESPYPYWAALFPYWPGFGRAIKLDVAPTDSLAFNVEVTDICL